VKQAIHDAFRNGSLVCGTSAGAALMSKKMITGNELKYPENEGSFKTIEEKNIETIEGLGLLEKTIIDQHFIKRKRLNRLISVSLENPEYTCVGIDESTAILVDGNAATVYGDNQVISLQNTGSEKKVVNSLLGGKDLWLNVFLPGESFKIKK
jgi:cyanophycinase